ncbi:uncharacterized protein Tdg [Calliphora vicina]|uniref:uncharacterized protein Tdg n=1 Tax=Calliphora vicina TaxID=7373 RepID=UPI00325B2D90
MQVSIPSYSKKSINSTAVLTESLKRIFYCAVFFQIINADEEFINSDCLYNKTEITNTTKFKTAFLKSLTASGNCNSSVTAQQNPNEFMGEKVVMAGASCKRYLQNKLGERKRRRPNSALAEAAEIVNERVVGGDTSSTRLRQTTQRQSTQRHLIATINNLTKTNKTDIQSHVATAGSKKYLRSNKQDNELLRDCEDLKKPSISPTYDTMNFRESDRSDIDNSRNIMSLANGNNHDFKNDENEENYKNLQDFEGEEEDMGEALERERMKHETQSGNEETSYNCSSSSSSSSSSIRPPSLMDINENENAHVPLSYHTTKTDEYEGLGNVAFGNHNTISMQNYVKDTEESNVREIPKSSGADDDVVNKHSVFTSTSSNELQTTSNNSLFQVTEQMSSSSRAQFSNNDEEQQVCSENSLSSEPSGEISMENTKSKQQHDEINPNEIDEQSQNHVFKLTNLTMNTSLINNSTKHPQNTTNIGNISSTDDEQYHHYNADENNGCAIQTSKQPTTPPPPPTPTPINITQQSKKETSNESATCFQETVMTEHDCPDNVVSSAVGTDADNTDTDYMKEEEAGTFNNPKTSININIGNIDQHNNSDCKETNLKLDPTTLNQSRHESLEQQEKTSEKLHDKLENRNQQQQEHQEQEQNSQEQDQEEDQPFDNYLEQHTQVQHAEFEMQQTETITHQQHEKDIIDAADKVYTQIEEQYHQHQQQQHVPSIPSTYEQMISNHQHQTNNQTDHDEHQHSIVHSHQQQLHTLQHSMQQYSADQLYQLQQQQQEHHHQQLHMNHQMHQKQQEELQQQQQHHNIPENPQIEHRQQQQHSHIMDFLHPNHHHHPNSSNTHSPLHQQQQQIHEVYHDLMMDEFHEEHNPPYKLGLSPSTVKHENQDDGYETSAGDVLTPNSHASSTHSVTPQHHMQHGGLVTNVVKCEDQQRLQQQSKHNTHGINERNPNIQQELVTNESTSNITPRDPYHFIDDDLNSANSNNLRNILTPPHSLTRSNQEGVPINDFMVMQSDASASNSLNQTNDMYALTNTRSVRHHHSQKPTCLDINLTTPRTNAELELHFSGASADIVVPEPADILNLQTKSIQKRRGRKKKVPDGGGLPPTLDGSNPNDVNLIAGFTKTKERKKHDRFNGMSEEEVVKRILPDHLCDNLDIVIIGINPGLFAAYKGHHYAGPGNHFWKCLYLSGLTQEQMNADEDFKLIKYGIGFTNMVQRATKGSADLTRKEIKEGSRILLEKLQRFRPKIAVFNGKLIFEVFSGKKDFNFGRQPECVEGTDTFIWVMPSSSARCAQLPRAADKVPFYAALKKFRDYLNGLIPHIDQSECVFTEERIKQQCEQENYKNQQNSASEANETAYQNVIGMSNTNNPLQNPVVGYSFDPETNAHGAGEGPGPPPPPPPVADNNVSNNFMMSSLVGTQHEKKKRGRPKKIKGQEIIDPVTGNKIHVNNQLMMGNSGEYANILNLSVAQVSNNEMPKKKRGRPKKVKPHPNMLQQQDIGQATAMLSQKPNIMSIQSLTSDITQGSPHQMQGLPTNHQHVALYSTPPPHQRSIYSPMDSPMDSPSLNCSYTTNTPPSQPHHDKLGLNNNGRESSKATTADLVPSAHRQHPIDDQNFGDSPPPSSPNICTVDFEPPTGSTAASSIVSENVNGDLNAIHQRLHSNHQRSRFNSPISAEAIPDHNVNEHFQQWLSPQPNHNMHSPAATATSTMFANSPQQPSLNYHDQPQQQQMQTIQQQQQPQHQEIQPQWPLRHQSRYDDPYLLSSQLHQTHSHNHATDHNHQSQHNAGDVARKSLSGLESLVDQIPTISESESIALSSAAAVNAQVAAAAAVESRLQGIQNASIADSQVVGDDSFSSTTGPQNLLTASTIPTSAPSNNNQVQQSNTTTNLLNSNFSVSNLAASAASSNNNHHENYGLPSNNRPLANPNAYHHSNLMAAAVLAAAAANTPTNLSTPTAAAAATSHHTSMYMDPHAHLTTHLPVNSIYPAAAPPPTHHHHHHSAVAAAHHHHAVTHYGSAPQHSASDYATTHNPYAPTQSSVATSHTLHMPSPNYPYGYATASSQSNYSAYPHSHHANHHHGHPHAHHTAHHLAMFDRLKPSDITGYTSGF